MRNEKQNRTNRDAGKARYTATRELMVVNTECDRSLVWAAPTRAGMDVLLDSDAVALHLNKSRVLPCSFPKTD